MTEEKRSGTEYSPEMDRLLRAAPVPEISFEVRERICSRLKSSLAPVRPLASMPVLVLRFIAAFLALAGALIAVMGAQGFAMLQTGQAAGVVVLLTAGVILFSLSLAWQMAPGSLPRLPEREMVGAVACGFLAVAALLFPWQRSNDFVAEGWPCGVSGLAFAVPAAIVFVLLMRRGAPSYSGILGGTLGAMAGLLGVTVLEFRCTYQNAPHVLVWHGGSLVVSIAAGVAIAWRAGRSREAQVQ